MLAAVSIDMSLGSTSYSMYFTSRVVPNTEIQTYSFYPNKIFLNRGITLPVAAASDGTAAHGLTGMAAPEILNTDTAQVQPSSLLPTISCHNERRFPMPRVHPVFMPLGIPLMISVFLLHKR